MIIVEPSVGTTFAVIPVMGIVSVGTIGRSKSNADRLHKLTLALLSILKSRCLLRPSGTCNRIVVGMLASELFSTDREWSRALL